MGEGEAGGGTGGERAMIQRAPFGVRARGLAPPPASPVQVWQPGDYVVGVSGLFGGFGAAGLGASVLIAGSACFICTGGQ